MKINWSTPGAIVSIIALIGMALGAIVYLFADREEISLQVGAVVGPLGPPSEGRYTYTFELIAANTGNVPIAGNRKHLVEVCAIDPDTRGEALPRVRLEHVQDVGNGMHIESKGNTILQLRFDQFLPSEAPKRSVVPITSTISDLSAVFLYSGSETIFNVPALPSKHETLCASSR